MPEFKYFSILYTCMPLGKLSDVANKVKGLSKHDHKILQSCCWPPEAAAPPPLFEPDAAPPPAALVLAPLASATFLDEAVWSLAGRCKN